jgi:RNA ligase
MSAIPTPEQIAAFEQASLVTVRPHNTLPLRIVNYTPRAQFERAWTPELLSCRGLVFDHQWNLVARPLPKFFNYEEHLGEAPPAGPLPSGPFTVTEKYDGSLGIVFRWKEHLVLSTRGSFHSEQAERGTEILTRLMKEKGWQFNEDEHTHLFEIIYPGNRIVVDYGEREDLQWLTSIHTASGQEAEQFGNLLGGIQYHAARTPEDLKQQQRANAEGYVLRYGNGQRVKIKFAQYVELHRLVTGLSATTIWEQLRAGNDPMKALAALPDELYGWADETTEEMKSEHAQWMEATHAVVEEIKANLPAEATRREFAAAATKHPNPHFLFLALDGNITGLRDAVWKHIRPESRKPVTADEC